ncbi:MAG: hypothetical protein ACYCSX_07890 [Acidimicrobiales bacterium]
MIVRSDDVAGNEVTGIAWPAGDERRRYAFVALFSDDGEVLDCHVREAPAGGT